MSSFAFTTTKWAVRLASKLVKADVRVHNLDVIQDDMSIVFAVNHFTRLETVLLPYYFLKHTGKEVWSLAAAELFVGRVGKYMGKLGTVSTQDPDRDKVIVHSLLEGENPWIIFPEGQMIKDKKVLDPAGVYSVYNQGVRRPPHKGAAILALRAEFYRHKLECIYNSPKQEGLGKIKEMFAIENVERIVGKRTVIIPVNVTYFPIRARDNIVLRMATAFSKNDLSERAFEELSVEGTLLSGDSDIDITLGDPIDVRAYLHQPEYAELMACGDDLRKLEADPTSLFSEASYDVMLNYMDAIYKLTRVNYDHIFATIIRYQGTTPFTERRYRNRIYLCAREIDEQGNCAMHSLLRKTYADIIYEDPSPKFHDFMRLCLQEKIIHFDGTHYHKIERPDRGQSDFHAIRSLETTYVIANEVEPLPGFVETVKEIAQASRKKLSGQIRQMFIEDDLRLFEDAYNKYRDEDSHPMDVGRPFLLVPERMKGGIVLVHGYLAAPLEVRALAEFLYERGYAVYGARLQGHGTSPEDLGQTPWEEWYESVNRGYVIIKSLTDRIILGGFSTGGCMALLGAGRKTDKIQAVFSINAPLKLRQFTAKLVPSVVSMTGLLKKIKGSPKGWEYVQNSPENAHINYKRNPLTGVRELGYAMDAMEAELSKITVPTLVIQGSNDPTVDPSSGPDIFKKVGTPLKELTVFERDNHGIVNGNGAEDVFERVFRFLLWAHEKKPDPVPAEVSEEELESKPDLIEATSEAS